MCEYTDDIDITYYITVSFMYFTVIYGRLSSPYLYSLDH